MADDVQYWVVGANWAGEDKTGIFFNRGYWELGWDDEAQARPSPKRQQMKPGDRIAVKSMRGQGQPTVTLKMLGVVTEVGEDKKRVYVNWVLNDLDREVPSHGCLGSIHGPYSVSEEQDWLGQVFRL